MIPAEASARLRQTCAGVRVIPVLVVEDITQARALAEALVAGGLPVLEVTLRTPCALDAITEMSRVPGAVVGAGTVLNAAVAQAAKAAGAQFAVSPGATPALLDACERLGLPLLPGATSASEVMALLERGHDFQKFFPAEASGGAAALKGIGGPIPQVAFCPTGGVTPTNLGGYLALDNVLCAGGSWLAPPAMMQAGEWDGIRALAEQVSL